MTTHRQNTDYYSPSEIDRLVSKAQYERAAFTAALIHKASRAIGRWAHKLVLDPLAARRQRQREYQEMMGLDEHMYHDLGISRGEANYAFQHGRPSDHTAANLNHQNHRPEVDKNAA